MMSLSKRREEINAKAAWLVAQTVAKLGSKRKAAKHFATSASNVGRWLKGVAITDPMLKKISPLLHKEAGEVRTKIYQLINYCRLMFGSNDEFAKELGVSSVTIFTWLRGSRMPRDEHIIKMEALAQVTHDNLDRMYQK